MTNSRMLEGIPSFPPSPSSSHHSFSRSESLSTLQQSSFTGSAEPVSADNDAGGQFATGTEGGLERNANEDNDTQGVFLTQVIKIKTIDFITIKSRDINLMQTTPSSSIK